MNTGGICIGCTMPGFPDAFAPFYKAPPGRLISSTASRMVGSFIRPLRKINQRKANMTNRWNKTGHIPSGWGHVAPPGPFMKTAHYFYKKLQSWGSGHHPDGTALQRKLQASAHQHIKDAEKRADERMHKEAAAHK
jgi:hydrogenase small subunit